MARRKYLSKKYQRKGKRGKPKAPKDAPLFRPKASRQLKPLLAEIGVPKAAPFVPDPFQLRAVEELQHGDVLVTAATGSGKTWIALQAMEKLLAHGERSWYASPLKALSNSKYTEFCHKFGKKNVGILTGDRKENHQAPVIVGTTEILRNQLYDAMHRGEDLDVDLVVLDEAHYLGDVDRGVVWEEVIIYLPARVRLLLLSATISNGAEIAGWLEWLRQAPCRVVAAHKRPVSIHPLFMFPTGEVTPLIQRKQMAGKVRHFLRTSPRAGLTPRQGVANFSQIINGLRHLNMLPAIFFLKSRADCNQALLAASPRLRPNESEEEDRRFNKRLRQLLQIHGYLKSHRQLSSLRKGRVAAHHGGQLPQWKGLVETMMKEGQLEAIFSTSTVAAGVNFPARTVVLSQSDRFNGRTFVPLSATDLLQMTGRAGRRGMDKVGFVVVLPGPYQDPHLIVDLLHSSPEPINSQIHITFSMVLNLLLSHRPEGIRELLARSFATYQNLEEQRELVEDLRLLEKNIRGELEETQCGDVDMVLLTLSKKRDLERQFKQTQLELRRSWDLLRKQAYLTPGRLFQNKKKDFFVTLGQESRGGSEGITALRVGPGLRRRGLRKRWLRFDKVASLLDVCFDLSDLDKPELWLQAVLAKPLDTHPRLEIEEPLPYPQQDTWQTLKSQLEDLKAAIAALPCPRCAHLNRCEPEKRGNFRKKINKILDLRQRVDQVTNQIWYEFNRHFHFLQEEDYVNETGRLSVDGVWASQLRLDQPLLVAESIRHDVFPHDDPAMLAGLIAPFVTDRDSHDDPVEKLNLQHPKLGQAFAKMVSALHPLRRRLRARGFLVQPLSFWPAAAIYFWIRGATWDELLATSGLDEGDLAMLIYRTADSLRQLEGLTQTHPRLAASATEAIELLLREPVVVPT
ncbi:MAG: DEAD/DEAH box helicase [Deltaproteobacteria bacterium]|nr:MAG: DEAD/DEAH box helicase [Deltaproteobacteria bacterium]